MDREMLGRTAKVRKVNAQWRAPGDRKDRCQHCAHAEQIFPERLPPYDKPTWHCHLLDCATTAGAFCHRWVLKERCDPTGSSATRRMLAEYLED